MVFHAVDRHAHRQLTCGLDQDRRALHMVFLHRDKGAPCVASERIHKDDVVAVLRHKHTPRAIGLWRHLRPRPALALGEPIVSLNNAHRRSSLVTQHLAATVDDHPVRSAH